MAVGDAVQGLSSIAAGAFLAIQPSAGVEYVIHNIGHESDAELHFYDGSNSLLMDVDIGNGAWMKHALHCSNSKYYRVKNTNTAAKLISFDGIQSK